MPTRAIKAIFYTRFHHEKGSHVLHQVPSGSITPSSSPSALPIPLVPFSSITQYLIPTQQFCDRLLTFCVNHHRVIGYPVCIREGKYSRNEFIFNFALVINENEPDWACYGEVVRKLGRLLRGLEEQGGFLSREEAGVWEDEDDNVDANTDTDDHDGKLKWKEKKTANTAKPNNVDQDVNGFGISSGSKVYALCEMVLEDLNNYAECMIPIDDSNTINLKLFPTRPPPPPISAHQVPVLTLSISSLQTPVSSDLTLNKILPHINGVNSISRIAQLADTDPSLTRRAIQHLVYYGCLVLLDIFSFGAIYAPTAEIGAFVADHDIKEECRRYVQVPRLRIGSDAQTVRVGSESEMNRHDRPESRSSSSASQYSDRVDSSVKSSKPDPPHALQRDALENEDEWPIEHETLIMLYTSLRQGLTLKNWVLDNLELLKGIDVRRLITFGIIKGFLYRVHKYAIANLTTLPPAPPTSLQTSAATSIANIRDSETATIRNTHGHNPSQGNIHTNVPHPTIALQRPSIASTTSLNPQFGTAQYQHAGLSSKQDDMNGLHGLASDKERENSLPLLRFLDGMHSFDEICTDLGLPERIIENKVRGMGDGIGVVIHR